MRDSPRSGLFVLIVVGATLALGVVLTPMLVGEPSAQAPPVIPPAPFASGMAFKEPPVVRSRDGRLRTTLVARNGSVEISGVTVAETQTFAARGADGSTQRGFLGPTLHVQPGDRIQLTLDSRLTIPDGAQGANCPATGGNSTHAHGRRAQAGTAQLTNLHYHGLHVTPRERSPYGDSVLIELPNEKSRYRFRIPRDHEQGTFWYHAHLHTCTDDQVYRGLAGLLLIGDSRTELPRRLRQVRTRALALKDVQVESPDSVNWQISDDHDWANGTHRTINGLVEPVIGIRPRETQLWRLANISSAVWYNVALVDASSGASDRLTVVAQDGNSLRRAVGRRSLVIPPGRRFDVLVRGPESGERVLKTLPFDQGRLTFPEDTLASVRVGGAPARAIAAPRRLARDAQRFPRRRGPNRRFTFDIDFPSGGPGLFMINDMVFDPKVPDATPTLGTTERWFIYNKSSEYHPFHIHQDDFRVVDAGGGPPPLPGDQDIVPLPPGTPEKPSRVVIDMPYTDYSGNFVFHCHILDHEDAGMMSRVELSRRER